MRILLISKIRRIHKFLRVLKMLMNFKNKTRSGEKLQTGWKNANVLIQLVIQREAEKKEPIFFCVHLF